MIIYINSPFTTSCTSVCTCPKMFVAEHWYSPESFAFTFFNSNLPFETADSLTSDRLPLLLHTTAGSGLPLTEHWNDAVPLSFTVRFVGETATTGAEIDSPGSPLVPGIPVGPVSPFWPLSPRSPLGPAGPMIPCFPFFPGDPIIPLSPLVPRVPFFPFRPRSPFFPLGPGGPGVPGGPGGPERHVSRVDLQIAVAGLDADRVCIIFGIIDWTLGA